MALVFENDLQPVKSIRRKMKLNDHWGESFFRNSSTVWNFAWTGVTLQDSVTAFCDRFRFLTSLQYHRPNHLVQMDYIYGILKFTFYSRRKILSILCGLCIPKNFKIQRSSLIFSIFTFPSCNHPSRHRTAPNPRITFDEMHHSTKCTSISSKTCWSWPRRPFRCSSSELTRWTFVKSIWTSAERCRIIKCSTKKRTG